jgi:hypothetical protein
MFAFADDWSGKLLDASCYDREMQQKSAQDKIAEACMPTGQTTAFVFESSGKAYRLDAAGNTKAVTALKNRADRTTPGQGQSQTKDVSAKVEGSETGGTITVTSIELQ